SLVEPPCWPRRTILRPGRGCQRAQAAGRYAIPLRWSFLPRGAAPSQPVQGGPCMQLAFRSLCFALVSGALFSAWAAQPAQSQAQREQEAAERARHDRMPDTPGTGRYPALKEESASLPNHVLYRPSNLAGLGGTKLGVYLFGNGACVDDGASSRLHLLEVASHGYLAI